MHLDPRLATSTWERPVKVGINLLVGETTMAGGTPYWPDVRAMAETVDAAGFDSLWLPDHFLLPYDFRLSTGEERRTMGNWDCWSMLSALAAVTNHVELGTLVLGNYRNPALLAKMADTVDEISGGRLILGIGSGWTEFEYRTVGFPHDHLGSRFEEAIQIIRCLLKDGHVDFAGRFYQARECELRPRGARRNGPPIMIGGRSQRMHKLAAEYADIWNGAWTARADQMEPMLAAIDDACHDIGRDPRSLVRTAGVLVSLPGDYPHREENPVWRQMHAVTTLSGTHEEIAAGLREYGDHGITHVQVMLDPMTTEGIREFSLILAELDRLTADEAFAGQH